MFRESSPVIQKLFIILRELVTHMARDDKEVRVGIVGLGGMGRHHSENITKLGHEVVAGTDVVSDTRKRFGEEFDAVTYETHADLYEKEDLDAVVITTPNKFHEPAAIGALESGYSVLCEKPLAHSLAAAERIADTARAADGFCMVGFHNRFSTPASIFKEYQAEGRFGDITHIQANYVRRRGIPSIGSWFTNKELSGGGALIDIGVHVLDFTLYLLDFPKIVEVSGVTRSDFGTRDDYADPDGWSGNWDSASDTFDVDDSTTAFIRCAGGQTITLEVSWAAQQTATTECVVRGTEAGAEFDFHDDSITLIESGKQGVDHYSNTQISGNLNPSGHEAEDELFLESVAANETPQLNTVDQGLTVQRIIDAIYRSSEKGRTQTLTVEPEEPTLIQQ
jgi:predicted dehydrogenase